MANHPRPIWQLRTLRWLSYITLFLLIAAFVSWLALPSIVKKIAVEQTQEKIGRKLSIGDVSFNPFILALGIFTVCYGRGVLCCPILMGTPLYVGCPRL